MPINLIMTSTVGFFNSAGTIVGPEPWIQTSLNLEGQSPYNLSKSRKLLTVSTVTDYTINRGNTSTSQTVLLTNQGNDSVTITGIDFTNSGPIPIVTYGQGWAPNGTTIIATNSTATFSLAYIGYTDGEYTNSFTVKSDATGGSYIPSAGQLTPIITNQVFTYQKVNSIFYFRMAPVERITTSTVYGRITGHNFSIIAFNGSTSSYAFSLTGSPGFTIRSSNTTSVRVIFDNNLVNDVNGLYTATLTASAFSTSSSVTITHNINVDSTKFYHYGDWLSAGAPFDSIVGISLDKISGVRTLTIGVGAGADGAPDFTSGGAEKLDVANLGIEAATGAFSYRYWAKVHRIPLEDSLTNQKKIYYSGDYIVKTEGVDYTQYFGEYGKAGSMFVIEDDGFGNILIKINHLREIPEDQKIATTLQNLTRSFYYYSPNDLGGGRYYQLGAPRENQTDLFGGFNNDGSIITFLVDYLL